MITGIGLILLAPFYLAYIAITGRVIDGSSLDSIDIGLIVIRPSAIRLFFAFIFLWFIKFIYPSVNSAIKMFSFNVRLIAENKDDAFFDDYKNKHNIS